MIAVTRNRPEQIIQRAVFHHLAIRGARDCFAFHVPNGGRRSHTEAAIIKGIGVRAGIPDIVAVRRGVFFGLELKASNGRLTAVNATPMLRSARLAPLWRWPAALTMR
jgi:hypothetical protein